MTIVLQLSARVRSSSIGMSGRRSGSRLATTLVATKDIITYLFLYNTVLRAHGFVLAGTNFTSFL